MGASLLIWGNILWKVILGSGEEGREPAPIAVRAGAETPGHQGGGMSPAELTRRFGEMPSPFDVWKKPNPGLSKKPPHRDSGGAGSGEPNLRITGQLEDGKAIWLLLTGEEGKTFLCGVGDSLGDSRVVKILRHGVCLSRRGKERLVSFENVW